MLKVVRGNLFQEHSVAIEPGAFISNTSENDYAFYFFVKRLIDILLAIVGMIISVPILIVTMILVKIESPGVIFYTQERVGLNGKYFNLIKIRSMVTNAEKNGARWATKDDPRVTKVGKFIRTTRIDELPQLWNVLKGDMAIVGPRPERPMFTIQFNEEIPGFINRLSVKPGLTGWAQVNGGYDLTPSEKLEKDLYYINNLSLWLDIKIIFNTFFIVFNGEGSR
jgi:exopolysaccharide biosynthesis polyprenyl glycosylphosphotransferase